MKATFIVLLIDTATSRTVNAATGGGAAGATGAGVTTGVGALGALPPPHAIARAAMTMTDSRFAGLEIEALAIYFPRAKSA
jgi:hypothetical protein